MREAWRWFGPDDPVTLDAIRQAGATDVVTALHDHPPDEAWTEAAVAARRALIERTPPDRAPLAWTVVESIPVHDTIKRGAPEAARRVDQFVESLRAVAACGVRVVCYNFMPVLDWTRTELDHPLPSGGTALRFDATSFAAFDLHILRRPGAEADYRPERRRAAAARHDAMDDAARDRLTRSVIAGLPGGMSGYHDLEGVREAIARYAGVTRAGLLRNIVAFLEVVAPEAERLGMRLAIHPDDPPRPLLGLPRAVSTEADVAAVFAAVPARANGLTWCLGSLSAGPPAAAMAIGRAHAPRIHFAHLRVVETDADDPDSFQEAAHLGGSVDLVGALALLLAEERRRETEGDPDEIPMRPDHGHRLLDDLGRPGNPGYGAVGRLRGLAELRGAVAGLRFAGLPA